MCKKGEGRKKNVNIILNGLNWAICGIFWTAHLILCVYALPKCLARAIFLTVEAATFFFPFFLGTTLLHGGRSDSNQPLKCYSTSIYSVRGRLVASSKGIKDSERDQKKKNP
ncbi:hypothetical protein ACJX0J_022311, partial [Zea mays]